MLFRGKGLFARYKDLKLTFTLRKCSTAQEISKIRNIGILAHIDAGKTTTTERMLYYSGTIRQMGEVHHGNTVTDYMDQERERGITITSAAVTFYWDKHRFNLLDTPGHIDFTMEVEQTLNVLDGAVVILDSSAGVEAQTLTVWRQADKYNIPRIVYLNKMDRIDADLRMCSQMLENKFQLPAVTMHLPVRENKQLIGIIDVLTLEKLTWAKQKYTRLKLSEKSDGLLWETTNQLRNQLIDQLSSVNDQLADVIIASDSLDAVNNQHIKTAVKEATIQKRIVPIFCGSSYKNIGIQPLMTAIVSYLPSPLDNTKSIQYTTCFAQQLAAKAFKVTHDKHRGPLVFFRLYSGSLAKAQKLFNTRTNTSEVSGKVFSASANEFVEVTEATTNGNIAVVAGLKDVMTGDLVTTSNSTFDTAKKISTARGFSLFEDLSRVPQPVFFCSIEPVKLSYQAALETALNEVSREDPSLRVDHNEETGQTVLSGMGELHLEIIRSRIITEYKIDVDLGVLQIAYRETISDKFKKSFVTDTKIGNNKQYVRVELSLIPDFFDVDVVAVDKTPAASESLAHITFKTLQAVKQGVSVGLTHGPKLGAQVVNTGVVLHGLEVGKGTSTTIIASTVTKCIQMILKESETRILEPVMALDVIIPDDYSSSVLSDLSQRRAIIRHVENRGCNKAILSETPLSELLGYSRTIRTLTSGTATFTMEFLEYQPMNSADEAKAILNVRGY